MIRLFVAIDLPDEIKAEVTVLCSNVPGARWVPREQLHLTMRFIGEVDGGVFREIGEVLTDIKGTPFDLRLMKMGYFPPRGMPRVLWVGIEPEKETVVLRNRIESCLVRMGIEPEKRKFTPHITLARLNETPVDRLTRYLAGNGMYASAPFTVNEFHLYSSFLTPKGAHHKIEGTYPLRGS
jgi:2'-5' RNA ligase